MEKLLKMEKYQFLHNFVYWCGMIGIFVLGFFTADTYVPEVMGPAGGKASSLADIFNGMVYDSTFLLIIISGLLALSFGQEFSGRTITLEVSAGHSRSKIFTGKIISYLIAFHIMALLWLQKQIPHIHPDTSLKCSLQPFLYRLLRIRKEQLKFLCYSWQSLYFHSYSLLYISFRKLASSFIQYSEFVRVPFRFLFLNQSPYLKFQGHLLSIKWCWLRGSFPVR